MKQEDRKRLPASVIAAICICCFAAAAVQHNIVLGMRRSNYAGEIRHHTEMPPMVAFSMVALGGFRGLFADMLWVRMVDLQNTGRIFELVQLSDWITKLEPRHAEIWWFHAWNLAYNVSALMPREEDKWRWVQNGIQLLRDNGIPYNRHDPELYLNLGWIFQHKIGGRSDPAHLFFKKAWAEKMSEFFGDGFPDYVDLARDADKTKELKKRYKLLPGIMKEADHLYGPLDWRTPQAHALYWAHLGKKEAAESKDVFANNRMLLQVLKDMILRGRLVYKPREEIYRLEPEPANFPKVRAFYREMLDTYDTPYLQRVYSNFLSETAEVFEKLGDTEKAAELRREAEML
ncbi:MAG: hypothetical protein ACOC6C_00595 [Verrucomicrobiota bacterium]